ncbi:MAG: undecaprenyl-diphosphate phosphatase [Aquificaceae bacterium]|nr:undecaprenyl-diphosphate phosphatase [Aquificaceae bacterium]MDW8237730.1 undecaprenyl-diphosphate phosphatase [Aquificaceae bacterium]
MKPELELKHAVVLGLLEGLTEFLPISSTGHLILASHLLGLSHTEFLKTFEISIQSGAILTVAILYWRRLLINIHLLILGFLPTAVIGFLLYRPIKGYLIGNDIIVVLSSILGGILLIFLDRYKSEEGRRIKPKDAFLIGIFQSAAFVPGVSRSGAAFAGGLILGLSRRESAEFSFLLAVPTVISATIYDTLKTTEALESVHWQILIAGFTSSFIFSILGIKLMLFFAKKNALSLFGLYRIFIGIIYGALFI